MIVDVGLNNIGNSSGWMGACQVGSGNATPNVLDTTLETFIASTTDIQSTSGTAQASPPYYGARTNRYRFGEGVAAGNLSEIGIADPNSGILFSRALILDGLGSPTTITVLADEFLDATYQLRLYPAEDDVTGTVTVSGNDYDYILRASLVTNGSFWGLGSGGVLGGGGGAGAQIQLFNGAIGAITSQPSGTESANVNVINSAYVDTNLYRGFTAALGLNDGNLTGGISAILLFMGVSGYFGVQQMSIDPPLPKTDVDVLSLGFRHSWTRGTIPP